MGILIKGMEMPENGERLCIDIHPDGKVSYNLDLKCRQIATAVYVPPHGRLIDADALIINLMDRGIESLQTEDFYEIQQAVADAPTIIEAEGE